MAVTYISNVKQNNIIMITIYNNKKKYSNIKFNSIEEALSYFNWTLDEWFTKHRSSYEKDLPKLIGKRSFFYFKDENDNLVHYIDFGGVRAMMNLRNEHK